MEFKHIEYFIETCRHTSISQAAESLSISQNALSRCIANMEAELGCTLFSRTVKGISLTEEGKYLYERFYPLVIPENRHGERLDYIPGKTLPLYLYVHKDNPLAKQEVVNFGMLKHEAFLMLDKKSYYRKVIYSHSIPYGYRPTPAFESSDVNHICHLVNTGKGIFLATKNPAVNILFRNIVMVPFDDDTLTYSIAFTFQDYEKLEAPARKFMEYILENTKPDEMPDKKCKIQ